jgi:hypothetical protein
MAFLICNLGCVHYVHANHDDGHHDFGSAVGEAGEMRERANRLVGFAGYSARDDVAFRYITN